MAGPIYLGGGGSEHDEAQLWDAIFRPGQRVTVWPFASSPGDERDRTARWLAAALSPRGQFFLDIWQDTEGDAETLAGSDVLVVPGGNTFDLLASLRRRDLFSAAARFHDDGGAIYGGSAGAVLMGADISPALGVDANTAGLVDLTALDLLGGVLVRPHYEPDQHRSLRARAHDDAVTLWAIPEQGGIVVESGLARASGPAPVHVFTPDGHHTHEAGSSWPVAP